MTTTTAEIAEELVIIPDQPSGAGQYFPVTASGTALTLASFSLTTALLSLINVEWLNAGTTSLIIPVAYGYGALAALIGGLWEFRSNSVFGATLSVSFGCFWLSTGLLLQFFAPQIVSSAGGEAFGQTFGAYLILWGIFAAYMTIGSYFIVKPAFLTMVLLSTTLFVLGFSNLATGGLADTLKVVGGYLGISAAVVAWYLSAALVINSASGRDLLPLWPHVSK